MSTHLRLLLLTALFFNSLSFLNAQQWTLHLSGNESYPLQAPGKGQYPILWYSSAEGRGVLLGGFGGGVSWQRNWKAPWLLKAQTNVFRSRYYDEPIFVVDEQGQSLGARLGISTNLNVNVLALAKAELAPWMQLGIGLGVQGQILSRSSYGEALISGEARSLKFWNPSLAPVMLVLPAEASSLIGRRWSVTARAELGLSPASRLPYAKKGRWLNTVLEVGYLLKGNTADER